MPEAPKDDNRFTEAELDEWANPTPEDTVTIGRKKVRVRAVTANSVLVRLSQEVEALKTLPVQLDGKPIPMDEVTLACYKWLEAGAVDPPLTFMKILQLAERCGPQLLEAGSRVMALTNMTLEAVEEAKNDSGETAATPTPSSPGAASPKSTRTAGSADASLPA